MHRAIHRKVSVWYFLSYARLHLVLGTTYTVSSPLGANFRRSGGAPVSGSITRQHIFNSYEDATVWSVANRKGINV